MLSGAITLTNSPISQTLTLTDGSYVRSLTAAAGTTTINYSYTTLQSDGAIHTVTLTSSSCGTASTTYTASASCTSAPACSVSAVASAGSCATATNTYSSTVLVTLSNPTAGTMTVADGVNSITFVVPASVGTVTTSAVFNGLPSDGLGHMVTVSLPGCNTATATYTGPASCTDAASIIASSAIICAGSSATLTAITCAGTVSWNTGDTGPTLVTPALTTNTSYTATCTTASSSATAVGTVTIMVPAVLSLQTSSTLVAAGTPVNLVAVGCTGTIAWSTGERVLSIVVTPTTGTNVYSATCITGPCTTATSISIQSTTACTVSLTTSSLPIGTVGQPYSATITATGGTAPYSFSMASGSLPAGITLNPTTGVLSGIPTNSGSFSTSIRITDSQSCSAIRPLAVLQIELSPVCSLSAVVTPGNCVSATNTYSATAVVTLANPTAGVLTITNGAQSFTFATTATNSGIFTATFSGLPADGISHTVTASLPGCSTTSTTYTAPASCSATPVCSMSATIVSSVCSTITPSITGGTTPYNYNWIGPTMNVTVAAKDVTHPYFGVGFSAGYVINGVQGKELTLVRGVKYSFNVNSPGHPFEFTTSPVGGAANAGVIITAGVTNAGATSGILTFTPSATTPDLIYYNCNLHGNMGWKVNIIDQQPNGVIANAANGTYSLTVTDAANCSATTVATVNCPCSVSISSVTPSQCSAATNTYSATAVVRLSNPTAGVLTITNGAQSLTFAATATNPATFTAVFNGLIADGVSHTVTASLPGCSTTNTTYTAPASCSVAQVCSVSAIATAGVCASATNTFSTTVVVNLKNVTTAGTLSITDGPTSITFATTVASSASFAAVFTGLVSDGSSHNVTASLPGCSTTTTTYTAPGSCTQPVGTKLVLDKLVNKSKAKIGDVLTYTLVLTNSGTTLATNVVVQDSMTTGLRYVVSSATAPAGTTFTQGTPTSTWKVATLSAGQSVSMTLQAIADSSGILYNKATIPGDTVTVCTSVPVIVCSGDTYLFQLTAPAGRSSYRWFNGSVEIPGQTTNVLNITAPGTYSLAVDNVSGNCPDFSCCPFIVEEDTLPTFQAQAVPVTCTGNTPQANGKIVLSTFKTGYTYQYSLGSSFNEAAPLSGSAKVIPAGGVIVSNLANPVVAQAYTIRVYNASGCYTDVTVMLLPNPCGCPEAVCVPLVIKQTKGVRRQGL
ncbi:hypothetical protein GCM10028808_74450 [Spirosoma migulaei]